MTDIVRETQAAATIPAVEADDDLLLLVGADPKTVLVRARELNGKTIPEFACNPTSDRDWFTGGLRWDANPEHALFITFSFEKSTDIWPVGVQTDLPSSPPYAPASSTVLSRQDVCILPISQAAVQYQFVVKFSNQQSHDPKILVTPINARPIKGNRSGQA
jgi:hypothetical protein